MDKNDRDLEAKAEALDASDQYRVIRRLRSRTRIEQPDGSETSLGLFVDVETTGLDPSTDEIIELAMVPFTYGPDGRVFEIREAFQGFNQPQKSISAEITELTGITDEMVAGHALDPVEVASFAQSAALVVAHNASFDRRFAEPLSDVFVKKPWACSMSQVDWRAEGYEGQKLVHLAMESGFFFDGHRALGDCLAGIELLAGTLPRSGVPAMARLLTRAMRPSWRIWAVKAPFDLKDVLKARGYRWNPEAGPANPRAWYVDVDDEGKDQELAYLEAQIYRRQVDVPAREITAYDRFSDRC